MKKFTFILVIVCSVILTQAQTPSYIPTNGLQAWFSFNGNTNDLSGSGNNASNYSATFTTDRAGNPSTAMSFNGISNWLQITTPSFTFTETGAFTYSVWLNKQTQPAAGIVLMSGNNTAGNFISILQGPTQTQFGTNMQQSAWVWLTCNHALNQWDHYVATYDNKTMKLYRNGVFQSTTTYTYTGATSANLPFYIGRGFGGGYFAGSIDDVGIWNRALTATEITNIYFNSISTSVTENNETAFQIYPNPASNLLNFNTSYSDGEYSIADETGKLIMKFQLNNGKQIDISSLPAGKYFLYHDEKGSSIQFVKQ